MIAVPTGGQAQAIPAAQQGVGDLAWRAGDDGDGARRGQGHDGQG
jgi:hypothetical protein